MSEHTIDTYEIALKQYTENYTDTGENSVRSFIRNFTRKGLKRSTILTKLYALRSFYSYLYRYNVIDRNPIDLIPLPKAHPPGVPDVLTKDEVVRLLEAPKGEDLLIVRDRAIMEVLYSSGLRLAELINLNLEDWNNHSGTIHIRQGKGARERIVPVGKIAEERLKIYLRSSERWPLQPESTPLFISSFKRRVSARMVQYRVKHWGEAAGISQKVTPHVLRHSCATHMLQNGANIVHLKELLGHESIAATARYLTLDWEHLGDVYSRCHPRGLKNLH